WQPGDGFEGFRCKPHTIVDHFESMFVIAAAAALAVEQPAADVGVEGTVRLLFLELIEAAFAAAVAQALPFRIRHFIQWLTPPERNFPVALVLAIIGC